MGTGKVVHRQILLRGQPAARDLAAHHEHVVLANPFLLAVLAGVAIFLLISAVELKQLLVLLGEMVGVVQELKADAPAQVPAVLLDSFHSRTL